MTMRVRIKHTQGMSAHLSFFIMAMVAGAPPLLRVAAAQVPPYSTIVNPGMRTEEIQQAINSGSGAVYFMPGLYKLTGPLCLNSTGRTYVGPGSSDPRVGSVLMQTSPPDPITGLGVPVFAVDRAITSVTISGLAFDGAPGVNARGIGAVDPRQCHHTGDPNGGFLFISTISGSYFLTGLAEGIDIPMQITAIEGNHFGVDSVNAGWIGSTHRHIHSFYAYAPGQTTEIRVINNTFARAKGAESVLFESGTQLEMIGNEFQDNDARTTLQINGMLQVVLEKNRFERNSGTYIIHFAPSRHGDQLIGNNIVRAQNNFYDMQLNDFIFTIDQAGGADVFMGGESGVRFTHSDGTAADLTDPSIANSCNAITHAPIYLSTIGPFNFADYKARNPNCCGRTETTPCK